MISTAKVIGQIVSSTPLLEEGLSRDIISYSALARDLRPQVVKSLQKPVKLGAIVMALKRISKKQSAKIKQYAKAVLYHDLTIRSELVELTYLYADSILLKQSTLFSLMKERKDIVCSASHGIRETTLIVSSAIAKEVEQIFQDERQLSRIDSLSSITIRLTKDTVDTPGAYYELLKKLAWEGINIVEVVSTYTELTILFRKEDVRRALEVLSTSENI